MLRHNIFMIVSLVAICFMATSCALPEISVTDAEPDSLIWPSAPYPPKIKWVKEVTKPEDHGVEKSFWQKVAEKISGTQQRPIVKPYGVLADSQGRLIVADSGSAVVHILDAKNDEYQVLGGEKTVRFKMPIGVTEDHRGDLYITDAGNGSIYRYGLEDRTLKSFSQSRLKRPTGIAYSEKEQLLFISDTTAHQIVVMNLAGQEVFRIGERGVGDAQFNYPTDLFIDRKDQLYVTDALNQRIQILTLDGKLISSFGESGDRTGFLAKPKGVAVDSQGHIYVCDALLDAVQVFDSSGRLLLFFGGSGNRKGEFWMPSGISIDSNDEIYVSDSFNRRIQVFRYVGTDHQVSASGAE